MRQSEQWSDAAAGRVVHFVGRVTDEVFSFLGPATAALADSGVMQTVVLLNGARVPDLRARFRESVQLVSTPPVSNPLKRWQQSVSTCRQVVDSSPLRALHLHGFVPYLIGASVARSSGAMVPLYYSPHGSMTLGALKGVATSLLWAARPVLTRLPQRPIVSLAAEASALSAMTQQSVDLVEAPVADAFFDAPRSEAPHPLVVTGSRNDVSLGADQFAQLAVLLGGEALALHFQWIGAADAPSMARLKAAGVEVRDLADETDRAASLARGWVYVAPGAARGFPVWLVEAMAAGLPCVALDNECHRSVIRHGQTGYLYRTAEEVLHRIAQLVDEPARRIQIGQAARREARARFSEATFRDSLFAAYHLLER